MEGMGERWTQTKEIRTQRLMPNIETASPTSKTPTFKNSLARKSRRGDSPLQKQMIPEKDTYRLCYGSGVPQQKDELTI